MDTSEAATPISNKIKPSKELLESKTYELKLNEDVYSLIIQIYSNKTINFIIKQINEFNPVNYIKAYNYNEITKILLLQKEYYDDINKVFKYCDTAIIKNKISLLKDKNVIKFIFKKNIEFEKEIECTLELNEEKLSNEQILIFLFDKIKGLKNFNNYEINNEIIKKLIKENEDMKKSIKLIYEENEDIKKNIKTIIEENYKLRRENEENKKIMNSILDKYLKLEASINPLIEQNKNIKITPYSKKDFINEIQNENDIENKKENGIKTTEGSKTKIKENETENGEIKDEEKNTDEILTSIHEHKIELKLSNEECRICRIKIEGNNAYTCKKCPLVLCDNCANIIYNENKKDINKKNAHIHPLIIKKRLMWFCNQCNKHFMNKNSFYCSTCGFDICFNCYKLFNSINENNV